MKRLLEGEANELEQGLLDALRLERPSAALEERMRAAIGLGPIPAAVPEPPPPASATVPAGKALGTWGILGAGAIVAALAVGGGVMLSSGESSVEAPPAPAEVAPPANPAEPAPTPAVAPEPRAPEPTVDPPANTQPRAQRGHVSPQTANAASLREEIRLIDSARIAVKKNDPARAISILDQYARRFPNGTFGEEARVLRAEARKLK